MAVRERTWRRWTGPLTSERWRFIVIARYALQGTFTSRIFLAFYVLSLVPSILALLAVYLSHNTTLIQQVAELSDWLAGVPDWIFVHLFLMQALPAFLVAVVVAPPLVAADIAHNALVLVLSRPIRRGEYVLGKLLALMTILSPLTWIPAMAVVLLQVLLGGGVWLAKNPHIAPAYLIGHWVWMLTISLLGLAVSAWVRHAAIARGAILAVLAISSVVAGMVNTVTRSSIGDLIHVFRAMESIVRTLFGASSTSGLPVAANWGTVVAVSLLSLWILHRKLRACEEVGG